MRLLKLARSRSGTGSRHFLAGVLFLLASAGIGLHLDPAFAQDALQKQGMQIYMSSGCFVCHGQTGTGGAGPGLVGDPFLSITDYVIAQILLGRTIMPAFGQALNDQQIAAVAAYIRNSWGNRFGGIDPQQVAGLRKKFQSMNVTAMGPSPPASGTSNAEK